MPDVRVENEIKMYSGECPFAYEGDDPAYKMHALLSICESEGFTWNGLESRHHIDFYYTDTLGEFDKGNIIVRYRDTGDIAYLTLKLPTIKNGMGLSRREIEGEILNDSRFDRWASVQNYVTEVYGNADIDKVPRLKADIVRGRCILKSKMHSYTFNFDKVVYTDPATGRNSRPFYELEFEVLDKAISEDPQMIRLIALLEDRYLFEQERVSKYARGMAFVRKLNQKQ